MPSARTIPTRMRVAAMDHFGGPDVIHTETMRVPKPGRREVLVRVHTAGVGTWDPALVDGTFQDMKPKFPRVIGSDGAGTVIAVGDRVERFAVGDRVYGWGLGNVKGGFFAEYAAIHEKNLAPIPESLSFDEAGALAVSGITALQGLDHLALESGARIIIFGASGGVGHVALQLAKRLGFAVFAVASKSDGVELVERLGADACADGHARSLLKQLREFSPEGYEGALVFAGAKGWKQELALVRRSGRIVWPNGVEPLPVVPEGVERIAYDVRADERADRREPVPRRADEALSARCGGASAARRAAPSHRQARARARVT